MVLTVMACSSGRTFTPRDTAVATTVHDSTDPTRARTPTSDSGPGRSAGVRAGTDDAGPEMSDTSLANPLMAVDRWESEAGTFAASKAKRAEVKQYARLMIDAHRKDLAATLALIERNAIAMVDSSSTTSGTGAIMSVGQAVSRHRETMDALRAASGDAFDRAYVDAMIAGHQDFLPTLQTKSGAANNDAVKQHLSAVEKVVADHLARAQAIQSQLTALGSSKPGA